MPQTGIIRHEQFKNYGDTHTKRLTSGDYTGSTVLIFPFSVLGQKETQYMELFSVHRGDQKHCNPDLKPFANRIFSCTKHNTLRALQAPPEVECGGTNSCKLSSTPQHFQPAPLELSQITQDRPRLGVVARLRCGALGWRGRTLLFCPCCRAGCTTVLTEETWPSHMAAAGLQLAEVPESLCQSSLILERFGSLRPPQHVYYLFIVWT